MEARRVRASNHARTRSVERHQREHSVGTQVRLAMKTGLTLPYDDQPGRAMVIARDGRRWVVDLVGDKVVTALPRLPSHFSFAGRVAGRAHAAAPSRVATRGSWAHWSCTPRRTSWRR
jgi:hypothetical protein